MSYDYRENVKNDCIDAVREWLRYNDVEGMSRDDLRDKLYDALWIDDNVTGNASGSYTFSTYEAEQNIAGNWDLLGEAMREFGCECDAIKKGAEWADVTIRCYLLGECLDEAMDEIEDEIEEATREKEEEEDKV
jgi:hypothetical protein